MIVFTSEEATVNALSESPLEGEFWAWMEAPHFGPVASTADLRAFSRERAAYFRSLGWDASDELDKDFELRDKVLEDAIAGGEPIVLLFGGAPRDQLTLARLAFYFGQLPESSCQNVRLSVSDERLSARPPDELAELAENAPPMSRDEWDALAAVWADFAGPVADGLFSRSELLEPGAMKRSLERLLREYPSVENGLSLTEAQILDAVALGVRSPRSLFKTVQETEATPFLTNWEFWVVLERLTVGETPLLKSEGEEAFLRPPLALAWKDFDAQELALTPIGEEVLEGRERYTDLDYPSRWIGGVEVKAGNLSFWDYRRGVLVSESEASVGR